VFLRVHGHMENCFGQALSRIHRKWFNSSDLFF